MFRVLKWVGARPPATFSSLPAMVQKYLAEWREQIVAIIDRQLAYLERQTANVDRRLARLNAQSDALKTWVQRAEAAEIRIHAAMEACEAVMGRADASLAARDRKRTSDRPPKNRSGFRNRNGEGGRKSQTLKPASPARIGEKGGKAA